jgi:hypothetical protein
VTAINECKNRDKTKSNQPTSPHQVQLPDVGVPPVNEPTAIFCGEKMLVGELGQVKAGHWKLELLEAATVSAVDEGTLQSGLARWITQTN